MNDTVSRRSRDEVEGEDGWTGRGAMHEPRYVNPVTRFGRILGGRGCAARMLQRCDLRLHGGMRVCNATIS